MPNVLRTKGILSAGSIGITIAGSLLRHYFRKPSHQNPPPHEPSKIDEWVGHAKSWLRENDAPNRVKGALEHWLEDDEQSARSPVDATSALKRRKRLFR